MQLLDQNSALMHPNDEENQRFFKTSMLKNLQYLADDILQCGERYFDKAIKDKADSVIKPS